MDDVTLDIILDALDEEAEKVEAKLEKVTNEAREALADAVLAQRDLQELRDKREKLIADILRIGGEDARAKIMEIMTDPAPVEIGIETILNVEMPTRADAPGAHSTSVRDNFTRCCDKKTQTSESSGPHKPEEKKTKSSR